MFSCFVRRLNALLNRTDLVVVPLRTRRSGERRRSVHPQVEILEDRTVPSAVSWVGGTSGDWDTASNWSNGAVPGATSDVVINTANATITHSQAYTERIHSLSLASSDTLNWSGGKLYLAGGSTLDGAVTLTGGAWTVSGNLTLDGLLTWTAGTMNGSGTTTTNGGIVFNNNGGETLDGRTLNNANSGTVTATAINLFLADGAVFNNEAGSNFNITSSTGYVQDSGATGTFKNEGTITQSSTTSSNDFDVILQNTGTVNVNSGTLIFEEGGSSTGTFSVLSGAQLSFDGGVFNLGSSSTVSGAGNVELGGGGTTNVNGTYNVTGTTTVDNNGTANFLGTLTDLGNTVNIGPGTAKIAKNVSIAALNLTGSGTLTGAGAVTVTSALTWNGGSTMLGTGSTTLNTGATMSLGGDNNGQTLDGRTFYNKGTVNWVANSSYFYLSDGAVFNNELGATFNANTPHSSTQNLYGYSGPSGTFINAGTFTTAPGAGNTTEVYNVLFNNAGTVNVTSGTLKLDSGGSDTKGTFFVPTGSTLDFNGGMTALASAIGSSTSRAAGTIAISGGTTILTGAVNDTGSFTIAISNGTADVEKAVTTPYLSLTGGTLYGTGAITVTATTGTALTWNGSSTMSGTGAITLNAHTTASLGGNNNDDTLTLDGRTFNNKGTVNWLAGSYGINLYDGAVFNNETGANFNFNTPPNTIQYIKGGTGPSGTFNNSGTFTDAPGAGNTTDVQDVVFNNSGKVNVNTGTLELEGGGNDTSAGSFLVPSAGTLQFNGGFTTLASSVGTSTTPQAGAVIFSNGTTDVVGKYNVSGSTSVSGNAVANFTSSCTLTSLGSTVNMSSGGSLDIEPNVSIATLNLTHGTLTGSGAVTVTNALTWNGGATMSGSGSTTLGSSATMSLGGDATSQTLDSRTFNNQGTTNWLNNSSNFYLSDVAVFNNSGTFNANTPHGNSPATQFIADGAGATGTFNNSGTFNTAAGSGNTTEVNNTIFNNTGAVNVTSGTLYLENADGTSTGSFALSSGTTLQFDQGIYNLNSATTSVTGAGNVSITNGETDFGGTYNISGATSVSGGSTVANFLNGGTTGTFTNANGGTVGLANGTTFTVSTGNYTQSGGSTYLNGGTLAVTSGNEVNIEHGSFLYGPGAITGNLANDGSIYVGGGQNMTGTLSVSGNFTQTSNGSLHFNIAGSTAGTQYDQLNVAGSAALGGTLDVSQVNNYNPSNTTFAILNYASATGNFATLNLPGGWTSSAGSTSFTVTS